MIPPRDFQILLAVALYGTLLRAQIGRLLADLFPGDDGRILRKRLKVLVNLGLVNVTHMRTVNPAVNAGVSAPVYYPSAKMAEFLAQETEDPAYRLLNATIPFHLYLYHFIAVAETHMMLRRAAELVGLEVVEWIGERDLADPTEKAPEKRYRLYHKFHEKLFCIPDAGFLLQASDLKKVFYVEVDRDTTKSAERVASQKCGGYQALVEQQIHLKKHFPAATWPKPNVLLIAPSAKRRDALRVAFTKKAGGVVYKFAAWPDLQPETLLTSQVWWKGDNQEPESLFVPEVK